MAGIGKGAIFEDLLPVMADKLGGEGLIRELCNGFQLLMDKDKGVITLESLRKNSRLLGLQNLKEDELVSMVKEGDLDGDGALSQMEFCVLMFRLSPELMEESQFWLEEALEEELKNAKFWCWIHIDQGSLLQLQRQREVKRPRLDLLFVNKQILFLSFLSGWIL